MILLLLIFIVPYAISLTEVILTRNQFNDFVAEMEKISMDINFEDANVTLDLTALEIMVEQQNVKLAGMIIQLGDIHTATQNLYQPLVDISQALNSQTQKLEDQYNNWYDSFEKVMTPINQFLASIHNAIGIIKDTVDAIQSIFEAFQGTQDEAISSLETNVQVIASNFEIGMKAIITESLEGSSMTFTAVECAAWEGDACESAFGEGPIACEGMEAEFCQMEGLIVEPVLTTQKNVERSEL